jgi:hypothetical protein
MPPFPGRGNELQGNRKNYRTEIRITVTAKGTTMRSVAREIGFAMSAWMVPFVVSVCIFPLKKSRPPLFDSLMGVVLAGSTVVLG